MRDALEIIRAHAPDFPVDGEMQGDVALSHAVLDERVPGIPDLTREANLLVMRNMDAATSPTTWCSPSRSRRRDRRHPARRGRRCTS